MSKNIKLVAVRLCSFKLQLHRNLFSDRTGGAHNAPPDPITGFDGVLLVREGNGMGGKGRGRWEEGKGGGCVMAFGEWTPLVQRGESTSSTTDESRPVTPVRRQRLQQTRLSESRDPQRQHGSTHQRRLSITLYYVVACCL